MTATGLLRHRFVTITLAFLSIGCVARAKDEAAPPQSSIQASEESSSDSDGKPAEPVAPAAAPKTQIVFVLDCSASMGPKKAVGRVDKMTPAKTALAQILNQIGANPKTFDVGFFAFGHRFRDARAARDVEELIALGPAAANVPAIRNELQALKPFGYTPLYQSISDACGAIKKHGQRGKKLLIVITDGENFVPGGNNVPAQRLATAAVAAVNASEIQLTLIGFGMGIEGGLLQGPAVTEFASRSPHITFLNANNILDVKQRIIDAIGLTSTPTP